MTRRLGTVVGATLAAGVLSLVIVLPAAATDAAVAGDARATAYTGNATTCAGAHLAGEIVDKGGQGPQFMDVTVPEGVTLTGIVVKGGDNYNVYPGDVLTGLHAPLVGNGDKNIPQISHWFACGTTTADEVSDESIDGAAAPMAEEGGKAANAGANSDAAGAAADDDADDEDANDQDAAAGDDDELAATGFSATVPLAVGGALLLIGSGLLVYLRRTRKQQD